nr:2'-5' RNA ligase family protein [Streptomyces polyasparticus]
MNNHWERPGWSATTRAYYWMLTFKHATALIDQARHCQETVRDLRFDAIAEDGLHLTMGRVGLTTDITNERLDRLVESAGSRQLNAFTAQALPLTASRGAIRYSVAPWTPLLDLHASLSEACTQAGVALGKPTSSLRPHIGIAYCNRAMDAQPVRNAILPLRRLPPVHVEIDRVELVELRREDAAYRWRTVHQLPLA